MSSPSLASSPISFLEEFCRFAAIEIRDLYIGLIFVYAIQVEKQFAPDIARQSGSPQENR
jgi:hypothetical protein